MACLADFAITGIIINTTVETSGSMEATRRDLVCYMAPEQMNPSLFNRTDSNASKETDVHSFAMTAYEVRSPPSPIEQLIALHQHQVLTGIQPYVDKRRPGLIIRFISQRSRPPRPSQEIVGPWLPDSVWEMIESCWIVYPWARLRVEEVHQTLLRSADDLKNARIGKSNF